MEYDENEETIREEDEDGNIQYRKFNGCHHRLSGPAFIWYNNSQTRYLIDGKWYKNFIEYVQAVVKYKKEK